MKTFRSLCWFLLVCLLAGCGGGADDFVATSSGSAPARQAAPVFRPRGTPSTGTVGTAGGTLSATADDGTVFKLTIPAGALTQDVAFTMAPVAVSGQLGLPISLPVAVQITPSGTQFTGGAQLDVTLPGSSNPSQFQPYIFDETGNSLSLSLATISGQTVSFVVYHLTTPGLSPEAVPTPAHVGVLDGAQQLEAEIAQALLEVRALQASGTPAGAAQANALLQEIDTKLDNYFQQTLKPLLASAAQSGSNGVCRLAIGEALRFERFLQQVGSQKVSRSQILELLPAVFRRGIQAAGQEAVAGNDVNLLSDIPNFYHATAIRLGLDTPANSLDAATVKSGVPLSVVLDVTAPTTLADGANAQIRVKPGYKLGNNPVKFSPAFSAVNLSLTGADSPDLPLQDVSPGGEAVFNSVTLSANTQSVSGTASAAYPHLIFGSAGPIEASQTFTIEGALVLALTSSGNSNPTLTATVTKGTAPLAATDVRFEVVTGSGTFNTAVAATDAQGQATVTFSGGGANNSIEATTSNGSQHASATLNVTGQYTVDPQLATYYGEWRGIPENLTFIGPWTEADKETWAALDNLVLSVQSQPEYPYSPTYLPGHTIITFGGIDPDPVELSAFIWGVHLAPNGDINEEYTLTTSPIIRVDANTLACEGGGLVAQESPTLNVVEFRAEWPDVEVAPGSPPRPDIKAHIHIKYPIKQGREVKFDLGPAHLQFKP